MIRKRMRGLATPSGRSLHKRVTLVETAATNVAARARNKIGRLAADGGRAAAAAALTLSGWPRLPGGRHRVAMALSVRESERFSPAGSSAKSFA